MLISPCNIIFVHFTCASIGYCLPVLVIYRQIFYWVGRKNRTSLKGARKMRDLKMHDLKTRDQHQVWLPRNTVLENAVLKIQDRKIQNQKWKGGKCRNDKCGIEKQSWKMQDRKIPDLKCTVLAESMSKQRFSCFKRNVKYLCFVHEIEPLSELCLLLFCRIPVHRVRVGINTFPWGGGRGWGEDIGRTAFLKYEGRSINKMHTKCKER